MKLTRTTVYLEPRQKSDLKRLAKWYDRTPAELLRYAIDEYTADRLGAGKLKEAFMRRASSPESQP